MEKELKEGWYMCYKLSKTGSRTVRPSYYKEGLFYPVMAFNNRKKIHTTPRSSPRDLSDYYKIIPIDINNLKPIDKRKERFFTRLINHLKAGKYFNNKRI